MSSVRLFPELFLLQAVLARHVLGHLRLCRHTLWLPLDFAAAQQFLGASEGWISSKKSMFTISFNVFLSL